MKRPEEMTDKELRDEYFAILRYKIELRKEMDRRIGGANEDKKL